MGFSEWTHDSINEKILARSEKMLFTMTNRLVGWSLQLIKIPPFGRNDSGVVGKEGKGEKQKRLRRFCFSL
ncbi:MAG: hypothetical protein LBT50_09445 [Prevotellaceae bacterium]|jgi:hypothetical protein|nr:hypothetical protein [Prevotellaceae bacterium]